MSDLIAILLPLLFLSPIIVVVVLSILYWMGLAFSAISSRLARTSAAPLPGGCMVSDKTPCGPLR